jgi:hypothetical protein
METEDTNNEKEKIVSILDKKEEKVSVLQKMSTWFKHLF